MGLSKGMTVLIARDAPSYALYFVSFEYIRRKLKLHYIESDIVVELLGGGIAGSLSWFSIMPIDIVKSRIQSSYTKETNPFTIMKSLNESYGIRGLFKGLTPVLIRGFIVNAITFVGWKRSLEYLNQLNKNEEI
jgi:solute carrier family 25 carnitine/acylcarnitine transporter 20/29